MAWQTPKTDWVINPKNPVAEDFNRIEGNIDFLNTDIETKKGLIVDAINDMNQTAEVTDTHAELADKIRDISNDANAAVGEVLSGKTFYQGGIKRTGTMPNRGAQVITPGPTTVPIPVGYHNGNGYVATDPDLIPANIKSGVNIFGVTGNYEGPYTSAQLMAYSILGLPLDIPGRIRRVTGTLPSTGSKLCAPADKTWFVMTVVKAGTDYSLNYYIGGTCVNSLDNPYEFGVCVPILTENKTNGAYFQATENSSFYDLVVYEIDAPGSGYYSSYKTSKTIPGNFLVLLASTLASSGSGSVRDGSGKIIFVTGRAYSSSYEQLLRVFPPAPLKNTMQIEYTFVVGIEIPYTLYEIRNTVNVTVPQGEMWLASISENTMYVAEIDGVSIQRYSHLKPKLLLPGQTVETDGWLTYLPMALLPDV